MNRHEIIQKQRINDVIEFLGKLENTPKKDIVTAIMSKFYVSQRTASQYLRIAMFEKEHGK